jgi:prepilin-type N-terminal cleavage/methylation domain-containing protein
MSARPQKGFTLVEVCIVLVILSILVRVSLPAFRTTLIRARAAQAIGDLNVIREAAIAYYAAHGTWPAEAGVAKIPAGLAPYLPKGYTFTRPRYRLDWQNWALPSGLPSNPRRTVMLGVSVVTTDKKLGQAVLKLIAGNSPSLTATNQYTMLLVSSSERL